MQGKNIYVTFDMIEVLEDIKFKQRFKKPSDSIKFLHEFWVMNRKKNLIFPVSKKDLERRTNENGKIKRYGKKL